MNFIPIKKWKTRMIGDLSNFEISSRLLMQSHFALIILSLTSAIFNYILNLGTHLSIILIIASLLYFVGYILIYSKNKTTCSFVIFIAVSLVLLFYFWINNGGLDGANLLLVYAFYTVLLFISNTKFAPYIIGLYIITTIILFYIELHCPEYIKHYDDDKTKQIDVMIISYSLYLIASPMLLFGKKLFEKAKNKAEESEKSKMEFLANISHDIRTPLNAIIGFTDLLSRDEISDEERHKFIETIRSNSDNLLYMVNNILNLSQIDSGMVKVEKSHFDVKELMENIYQTYNPLMLSDAVKLSMITESETEETLIYSDKNLIYQILTNLLNNSIKFTKKGQITLGVKINKDITFYVKDTGPGIPKNMQDIIFDRFKQLAENRDPYNKGVGLGLAICSDIVKLLGGSISLISDATIGTYIHFTIPNKSSD